MVALGIFQALLNGIGWILASIYDLVGNFGVSIIVLTILIKVVLLPLGIKQIKSMQAMQAIQPKIKEIQKKYKGNKPKAQEETMKLYREAGVNPLGGCLPLLLQFPILIAMYAVIRPPQLVPATDAQDQAVYEIHNNHLPVDSQLFQDIIEHQHLGFVDMNLQCSARQSGKSAPVTTTKGQPVTPDTPILNSDGQELPFDATTGSGMIPCGSTTVDRIPYFVVLALMIVTMFYQQLQMQRASPPGAASGQQQQILKFMPLLFGFIGYSFPAGLVLYWTTSNVWQIGQQYALLRAGHIGPEAMERRMAEQRARASAPQPAKQGFFARLMDQANQQQNQRGNAKAGGTKGSGTKGSAPKGSAPKGSAPKGSPSTKGGSGAKGSDQRPAGQGGTPQSRAKSRRPNTGQAKPKPANGSNGQTPSGGDGGDGEAGS
jgi:YidC/Oxa1 family membrane protein insertase